MNINQMMKQAQQMQAKMEKAQAELAVKEYTHEVNGAVKIVANGNKEILNIEIDADLLEADNKEILQDMILVALNETFLKIDEEANEMMSKATGNLKIPGLF